MFVVEKIAPINLRCLVHATGSETVRVEVDVLIFPSWGVVGWGVGWDVNVHVKLQMHPWGDCDFCQICLQLREKHQQKLKPQQDSIFSIILESKINGKTQGSSDV